MPECADAVDEIVSRIFVMAHLLTAHIDLAESATLEAIDAWVPGVESGEHLFRHVVEAALRENARRGGSGSNEQDVTGSYLPIELRAVLELKLALRQSFALRILAGFSREVCAELLCCPTDRVEKYTQAAARHLPSIHWKNSKRGRMDDKDVDQRRIEPVAYHFWLERGRPLGSPDEDWFRAEQELRVPDGEAPAVTAVISATAEA